MMSPTSAFFTLYNYIILFISNEIYLLDKLFFYQISMIVFIL